MNTMTKNTLERERLETRKIEIASKMLRNMIKHAQDNAHFDERVILEERTFSSLGPDQIIKEMSIVENLFGCKQLYFKMLLAEMMINLKIFAKKVELNEKTCSIMGHSFDLYERTHFTAKDYDGIAELLAQGAVDYVRNPKCGD